MSSNPEERSSPYPTLTRVLNIWAFLLVAGSSVFCAAGQVDIPGPTGSGAFGTSVTVLPNGNFVVTDPNYSIPMGAANVGAVYLYSPTGTLISTLTGSTANDQVGNAGVTVLPNGSYLVRSTLWDDAQTDVGAVTWASGSTGITGTVSAANSLIGSSTNDQVGNLGVTILKNGNYVVRSSLWNGAQADVGAVTWGNGSTGTVGVVSAANSLVGSTTNDLVGFNGVTVLANGNYVVVSINWDDGAVANVGAVTWGSGTTGISGVVSAANSLVGSQTSDGVGNNGVVALTNGNYVVVSALWKIATATVGAVTWGNGTTGIAGQVSASNSLVGSTNLDVVGNGGVTALTNGNYVVRSPSWDRTDFGPIVNAGAVTWGNGTTGIAGAVSAANSLVGSTAEDKVGLGSVTELTNGNYVAASPEWFFKYGAVTWGNGATGIVGAVSISNSLVGRINDDQVGNGGVTALPNGNYVVRSTLWNGAQTDVGAVTRGNGSTGIAGEVTQANSLVGSSMNDQVGSGGLTVLTNGNFVVRSNLWNNGAVADAGAVTWVNAATGVVGEVTAMNSLVGTATNQQVGNGGVTALKNGNYVAISPSWYTTSAEGAVTWGNGSTGIVGPVSAANSLVGDSGGDQVGNGGVTALANGNYVVVSTSCDEGMTNDVGAVTWGNGATGISGVVSAANSLVGSLSLDQVGSSGVTALSNGNYVVATASWNGSSLSEGAVTWGNGSTGVVGTVSAANSLVGSTFGDSVGTVSAFNDGNYIVRSNIWDNGATADAGAVTPGFGLSGAIGPVAAANSIIATIASAGVDLDVGYSTTFHQVVVGRRQSNLVSIFGINRAPQLAPIGNKTIILGETVSFTASAPDPEGDTTVYSLVGAPTGASIDASTGAFTFTPPSVGAVSFSVRASDQSLSTSETITITVTDSISLTSGPTAMPSTASVGQPVAFGISVASSGAITYAWNIAGTTLTEASPTFTFTAAGVYTVNVTASTAAGTTVAGSVTVTVVEPLFGTGNDTDGDGYSDEFETAAGTNPSNASDSPSGGGTPVVEALTLSKFSIKLNFAKAASDSISFSGTLPIAAGFNPANQKVTIDVGGVVKAITLDLKGKSPKGNDSFKPSIKASKGVVAAQNAAFSVKLSKGDFAAALAGEGLSDSTVKGASTSVIVRIIFGGAIRQATQPLTYSANAGKSGSASVPK